MSNTGAPCKQLICLTGTFHSSNRGDAAIQLSTILELQQRFPDAEVALLSSSPVDDCLVYPGVRIVRTSRRDAPAALRQILAASWKRLSGNTKVFADEELMCMAKATLVIDLSGDGFTETFGWKCPASHSVPLLLARILDVPVIMLGQTVGPFQHGRRYYRWLFNGTHALLCRDAESIAAMKALKVTGEKLHLTADPAFLLPPAPAESIERHLPDQGADSTPLIGITPSNLYNASRPAIRRNSIASMAYAAGKLATTTGGRILIIPTVFGPSDKYDDRFAARELLAALPNPALGAVLEEPLHPGELKTLLGRCDLYIGMRMHGLILAASQGVPCVAIAYADKTRNLFKRLGLEEYVVPLTCSGEELRSKATELWAARENVRSRFNGVMASAILPASRRNFDFTGQFLHSMAAFEQ